MVLAIWLAGLAPPSLAATAPGRPVAQKPLDVPVKLPAPIIYELAAGSDSAVTFRHDTHDVLAGKKCLRCHPEPFRMLAPTRRILHADMESGGSCGRCHDGRAAFGVTDSSSCLVCHAGRAKASLAGRTPAGPVAGVAPRPLPRPLEFKRGESSPGPVRFRHETHVQADGACRPCHPGPFRMKATGGIPGGAMHESGSCGSCHDGTTAFAVADADACGRCHRSAGARP
jgi:c(7)-type cytochrome triheme protein